MRRIALAGLVGVLPFALACSLLTSLDGFSTPDATAPVPDGGDGAPIADASDGASTEGAPDGAPKYDFTDDFARADTQSGLGNGWHDKFPAFRLASETAIKKDNDGDYRDQITTRPASESVLDVEVDVTVTAMTGYSQVHARVQTDTLGIGGTLDSYLFFFDLNFDDHKTFTVARQHGSDIFVTLTSFKATEVIDPTKHHRLRFRVTGTTPVTLTATVEKLDGSTWLTLGTVTTTDSDPAAIVTAGTIGFSAGNDAAGSHAYDDFHAFGL